LERLHNHSFYNMGENTLGWNKNNTSWQSNFSPLRN
jgi:hypothetical protein